MTSSIPKTCTAIVLEEANAPWKFKEVTVPEPQEGEILIKTEACGVCHSDVFLQEGRWGTFPRIPGHEVIGSVVAVGPGVKKWKVGDRAGGPWHGGHDMTCGNCDRGLYQMCENELINGITRDGGYSEYCTLRTEAAVRIPEGVDAAEYAPLLCAGVTVFNGLRQMKKGPGSVVAIQGLGGLGHLAVQYAANMGFRTVVLSTSAAKKDFAHELGATDYIDSSQKDAAKALQEMGGADMIAITAPNPKIMGPLVAGLAPTGTLLILAPVGEVPIDTTSLILKCLSVRGWNSGHALDSEDTIRFSQVKGVKCMIERFPFAQAEEAIKKMQENKVRFRGVLVFD
ncbi:alcohol dehydrogenase [Polyplosphaeria fusca]|uniref:Alcohol dehydrogenase n=1 Tax=Polyplosphaeria fusca TaxID=682080 RepID=A0A9P4UWK8_9PLEO|nr:alcohol dehydrogenase [Polyplosphaeria fusca]